MNGIEDTQRPKLFLNIDLNRGELKLFSYLTLMEIADKMESKVAK